MKSLPRILLIEDDASAAVALQRVLQNEGYDVVLKSRGDLGLQEASQNDFDTVVTDLKMPGLSGMELVQQLHQAKPRLPIVLMTAHGTTETAIEATKLGAYEYLLKPFEMEELIEVVRKAVGTSRLMFEQVEMGQSSAGRQAIIGSSRPMQTVYKEIGRIATRPVNVLICGETGTGKELVAQAIYQHSERARGPFIAVNCAAIPETLLESELFGHERGAFTGANARRIGRFEQANNGTIFLDEIGDMSPNLQAKLLRLLQEKTLQRLGGKEWIPVDVRVLAATHRDLELAIREKQFREDLFYRLSVVVIHLPPLRQRLEDIPALVQYFLQRYGEELGAQSPSIQPAAVQHLQSRPWPGNVRELENVVRKALLLARGFTITVADLEQAMAAPVRVTQKPDEAFREYIQQLLQAAKTGQMENVYAALQDAVERELFSQAIRMAEGNQAKAARWLGVSRLTMREKLLHFNLHPGQSDSGPMI